MISRLCVYERARCSSLIIVSSGDRPDLQFFTSIGPYCLYNQNHTAYHGSCAHGYGDIKNMDKRVCGAGARLIAPVRTRLQLSLAWRGLAHSPPGDPARARADFLWNVPRDVAEVFTNVGQFTQRLCGANSGGGAGGGRGRNRGRGAREREQEQERERERERERGRGNGKGSGGKGAREQSNGHGSDPLLDEITSDSTQRLHACLSKLPPSWHICDTWGPEATLLGLALGCS